MTNQLSLKLNAYTITKQEILDGIYANACKLETLRESLFELQSQMYSLEQGIDIMNKDLERGHFSE